MVDVAAALVAVSWVGVWGRLEGMLPRLTLGVCSGHSCSWHRRLQVMHIRSRQTVMCDAWMFPERCFCHKIEREYPRSIVNADDNLSFRSPRKF